MSIDSYMNIQLSGAEEYIDQQMTSALGQVLIRYVHRLWLWRNGAILDNLEWISSSLANYGHRCNNVLWIQAANQNNGSADTKMEG